jgi:threonine synthase
MNTYQYICTACSNEFDSEYIESNAIYLCPDCGIAERKKPLEGVMTVEYDYESMKKAIKSKDLYSLKIGDYTSYKDILPLINIEPKINITLNPKIYSISTEGDDLQIFDDTLNPTLSYKDRATLLVCYKAIELGIKDISAASTGNAGSSLAGIAAKLGLNAHIFVPKRIPDAKRLQIQSFGANIYLIDGTYDDAFDICTEISNKRGWYNRNTAYNPLTIEGKKTAAIDMYINNSGRLPDSIYISVGDGVILAGLYKGFYDLLKLGLIEKIPRLVAVQAECSNALVRYLQYNKFEFIETNTIADSIDAAAPRNLYMASESIKKTDGIAVEVTDEEIVSAQQKLVADYGIMCEPSAAAVFAGYNKLRSNGDKKYTKNALLMITGNGLKDIFALERWNIKPNPILPEDLIDKNNL